VARRAPRHAGEMILQWQRAQLASLGINPDSGVDLVEERAEVERLRQRKYAEEKARADGLQRGQDMLFAVALARKVADWMRAEAAHEKSIEEIKKRHEHKLAEQDKERGAAHTRITSAQEHAKSAGVSDAHVKAAVGHAADRTAPPPALELPPPLA